ncbi:hypothetical protein AMST5_02166 [freshwater sediment metagenome]|uniref:Uncharacterized protein n=1 Tax=freshwater sediment metagenome TaxID=556182 RepID=A0AA48LZP1_9ZZZZ
MEDLAGEPMDAAAPARSCPEERPAKNAEGKSHIDRQGPTAEWLVSQFRDGRTEDFPFTANIIDLALGWKPYTVGPLLCGRKSGLAKRGLITRIGVIGPHREVQYSVSAEQAKLLEPLAERYRQGLLKRQKDAGRVGEPEVRPDGEPDAGSAAEPVSEPDAGQEEKPDAEPGTFVEEDA